MAEAYLKRSVSCMNGRGLRLVASAGVAAALAVLLASPLALSAERGGTEEQWTDWRALSQGFIGRYTNTKYHLALVRKE